MAGSMRQCIENEGKFIDHLLNQTQAIFLARQAAQIQLPLGVTIPQKISITDVERTFNICGIVIKKKCKWIGLFLRFEAFAMAVFNHHSRFQEIRNQGTLRIQLEFANFLRCKLPDNSLLIDWLAVQITATEMDNPTWHGRKHDWNLVQKNWKCGDSSNSS
jgi:hypothetical protein